MASSAVQTFGKYQILERIAMGGMAEIYKAKLEGIGGFKRTFAIKRILPHLSQNDEYIAMLVDEAKVAGLLSHANIVQIMDLGQVDDVWYIAMEYVDGPDLGTVLRRLRDKGLCLPLPYAVFIIVELLKGLEYAHQRQIMRGGRAVPLNIIHRDISPPNILLSTQGEVKLTDFGIARAGHKAMETQSGIIKGRFDYMSPEQAAAARDLDQRSDLFSVGVVLYQMLAGDHPFRADSEYATLDRIRAGRYAPVSSRNAEVPLALETIVDRALRVDRAERYPSATAFKEALDKFFHDAQFLFSQKKFAGYIRDLFPDKAGRAEAAELEELLLDDEQDATNLMDGQGVAELLEDIEEGDEPETVEDAAGRPPSQAEVSRLSEPPRPPQPSLPLDPSSAADADEQETLLRPGLLLEELSEPRRETWRDEALRRPPSTLPAATSSRWGWWVALAFVTWLIGLVMGGAAGLVGADWWLQGSDVQVEQGGP